MTAVTNGLEGLRAFVITEFAHGEAALGGTFTINVRGQSTDAIAYSSTDTTTASNIQTALNNLDSITAAGVTVTVGVSNAGFDEVYVVSFTGDGGGGDVESLSFVAADQALTVSGSGVAIYADETAPFVTGGTTYTPVTGAEITGSFTLTLRGHTTDPFDFNAADTTIKTRLEALANVRTVHVTLVSATEELRYTWSVTFDFIPGYYPC